MLFDHFKKRSHASVGKHGEDLATVYLKKQHYKILTRNYRNKYGTQVGEIDIIAKKKDLLIFVEVKTRTVSSSTIEQTLPEEQITAVKLQRLQKAATIYLHENNVINLPHRFDAISIKIFNNNEQPPIIDHIKSIFL